MATLKQFNELYELVRGTDALNYEIFLQPFKGPQINSAVILRDKGVIVLTDIAQGVLQSAPAEGVTIGEDAVLICHKNYSVYSFTKEEKVDVEIREEKCEEIREDGGEKVD